MASKRKKRVRKPPKIRKVQCGCCPSQFISFSQLTQHVVKKHRDVEDLSLLCIEGENPFIRCLCCEQICAGQDGVKKHQAKNSRCQYLAKRQDGLDSDEDSATESESGAEERAKSGSRGDRSTGDDDGGEEIDENNACMDGAGVSNDGDGHKNRGHPIWEDEERMDKLHGLYMGGLYKLHHSWRKRFTAVCSFLFEGMCQDSSSSLEILCSHALLLLPGILQELRFHRAMPVGEALREWATVGSAAAANDRAKCVAKAVIDSGAEWAPYVEARCSKRANDVLQGPTLGARVKRLESLVRDQRLSAAMAELENIQELRDAMGANYVGLNSAAVGGMAKPALSLDEIKKEIETLNPEATEQDVFTPEQEFAIAESEPLEITAKDLARVLGKLPVGSASGSSAWTYGVIRSILYEGGDEYKAMLELVTKFINKMLSGKMGSRRWVISRAVLLPKKDGGGWRPIGIGEAWYRLAGRVAVDMEGSTVGAKLMPLQLGCGIQGGCEIAGRLGQIYIENSPDNHVVLSVDLKNAFNTMPRRLMLEGLLDYCPSLSKWFLWAYGSGASPLVNSRGEVLGYSARGSRQGDPLGGLCFCVGFQAPLDRIAATVEASLANTAEDRESNINPAMPHCVWSYVDDLNIGVPVAVADEVARGVADVLEDEFGLLVSMTKSRVVGPATASMVGDEPFFKLAPAGKKMAGVPTGTHTYCTKEAKNCVAEAGATASLGRFDTAVVGVGVIAILCHDPC
jgi:hypothetical protein